MNDEDPYGGWPPCLAHDLTLQELEIAEEVDALTKWDWDVGTAVTEIHYDACYASTAANQATSQATHASSSAQSGTEYKERLLKAIEDGITGFGQKYDDYSDTFGYMGRAYTETKIPMKEREPDLNEQLKDNPLFGSF